MSIVEICNTNLLLEDKISAFNRRSMEDTIEFSCLVSNATQTETSAFYGRAPIMQVAFTASLTNYTRQR